MAIRRAIGQACLAFVAGLLVIGFQPQIRGVTVTWNANPEPDLAGYRLFWGETNASPTIQDVGKTTQAQVTNLVSGTTYRFYLTAYNTAGLESDPSQSITYTVPSAPPPPPPPSATMASFVRQDLTSMGSWLGAYGKNGCLAFPGGNATPPGNVSISAYGNYGLTWATSTTDPRALQKKTGTDRFAGSWQNTNWFEFYLRLPDSVTNQVSFYFVDFDRQGRSQLLELFELGTGKILGRELLSNFENGRYSIWDLRGNIGARITKLSGPNAVLSGIFFDEVRAATASFVGTDPTTSGSWIGQYGSEGGLAYPGGELVPPAYVRITGYQNYPLLWSASTSDSRGLQKTSGSGRFAGAWHSTNDLYFMLQFNDGLAHQVSFYFLDFERAGREQQLELLDHSTGNRLEAATISEFGNGVWVSYNLKGKITVKLTRLAGPNTVLSAILFDGPGANYAEFREADTVTAGTWIGTYGSEGQWIATESAALPAYANLTVSGANAGYWATTTTDPTALQRSSGSSRVASAWVTQSQFNMNINLSDAQTHLLSLYFVDFNNQGRKQLVEIIDPQSGIVLDSTEVSAFRSGIWLSYDVLGEVIVRVTSLNQFTPVLSGVFFD